MDKLTLRHIEPIYLAQLTEPLELVNDNSSFKLDQRITEYQDGSGTLNSQSLFNIFAKSLTCPQLAVFE